MATVSLPLSISRSSRRLQQRGVALVFALIGLVALTLGAVALIRSIDTGVLALGNLAFKQSGIDSGSRGAETAMDWLAMNMGSAVLEADQVAQGYYAASLDTLDPTGRSLGTANVLALVDWNSDGCLVGGAAPAFAACIRPGPIETLANGDTVRYVITRLCQVTGPIDTSNCAVPPIPSEVQAAGMGGGGGYGGGGKTTVESYNPYFRVITRTVGPKGTVSFTETLAHF